MSAPTWKAADHLSRCAVAPVTLRGAGLAKTRVGSEQAAHETNAQAHPVCSGRCGADDLPAAVITMTACVREAIVPF